MSRTWSVGRSFVLDEDECGDSPIPQFPTKDRKTVTLISPNTSGVHERAMSPPHSQVGNTPAEPRSILKDSARKGGNMTPPPQGAKTPRGRTPSIHLGEVTPYVNAMRIRQQQEEEARQEQERQEREAAKQQKRQAARAQSDPPAAAPSRKTAAARGAGTAQKAVQRAMELPVNTPAFPRNNNNPLFTPGAAEMALLEMTPAGKKSAVVPPPFEMTEEKPSKKSSKKGTKDKKSKKRVTMEDDDPFEAAAAAAMPSLQPPAAESAFTERSRSRGVIVQRQRKGAAKRSRSPSEFVSANNSPTRAARPIPQERDDPLTSILRPVNANVPTAARGGKKGGNRRQQASPPDAFTDDYAPQMQRAAPMATHNDPMAAFFAAAFPTSLNLDNVAPAPAPVPKKARKGRAAAEAINAMLLPQSITRKAARF